MGSAPCNILIQLNFNATTFRNATGDSRGYNTNISIRCSTAPAPKARARLIAVRNLITFNSVHQNFATRRGQVTKTRSFYISCNTIEDRTPIAGNAKSNQM